MLRYLKFQLVVFNELITLDSVINLVLKLQNNFLSFIYAEMQKNFLDGHSSTTQDQIFTYSAKNHL